MSMPPGGGDTTFTASRAAAIDYFLQKRDKMKIALTTSGNGLNAPLDGRFGRAPKFLIYDLKANTFEVMDNEQNLNALQGAGIQSAQNIARLGVKALVTGYCGPKATKVLKAAGIKIYNTTAVTVMAALDQFRNNRLSEASSDDD